MAVVLVKADPTSDDALSLIEQLDSYQRSLYPPEVCYLTDPQELIEGISFYLAYEDKQVLGCGGLMRNEEGFLEIKRMFVSPAARGKGVGQLLLKQILKDASATGDEAVFLETGPPQIEAIRLYEKVGFEKCGPYGGYEDHPLSVFMTMRLQEAPSKLEMES